MANLTHAEHDPKRVEMSGDVLEPCAQKPAVTASSAARVDLVEVPCDIPSFAAASELVSAPYSCLVMNTRRRHVVLPPVYLYKKRTALREELQAELLKFSPSLQGVPLAYDNIQLVRSHGDIYDDSGYIHMDIQANFIIFQPQEGQRLLGKVNKLGVSHVGCLVHGCFNASIPKPNLVSVDTWRDAGPRIGAELEFEVVALDADTAGVLLIRGRLNRTRVQELLAITESSDSGVAVDVDQVELEDIQPVTEAPEETVDQDATKKKKKKMKKEKIKEEVKEEEAVSPSCQLDGNGTGSEANGEKKKKKKKKRDKLKEVIEEMSPSPQDDGNTTLELNGTESDANGEKKKKKKMKKEKRIKEEEEPVQILPTEIHASDSSGYHSDKPNKRKREKEIQLSASFSQEAFEPKSKKKKKENDIA